MQGSPRIDELRQKFHENPRRYFAPLANEYRKAGDPEQAIAICRAHLAQQPQHMSGHVVYGQALYDARRADEARTVFEKALALDPDNAIVLRQLGDIAREKGESAEARHWYSKALDLDSQDSEAAAYLAELEEPLTGDEVPLTGDEEPTAVAEELVAQTEEAIEDATPAEVQGDGAEETAEPESTFVMSGDRDDPRTETQPAPGTQEATASDDGMPEPEEQPEPIEAPGSDTEPEPVELPEPEIAPQPIEMPEPEIAPEPIEMPEPEVTPEPVREPESDVESIEDPIEEPEPVEAEAVQQPEAVQKPEVVQQPEAVQEFDAVQEPDSEDPGLTEIEDEEEVPPQETVVPWRKTPQPVASPFVTRTMAELYLKQGYTAAALDVYRQLAIQNPDDAAIRERIEELSPRPAATEHADEVSPETRTAGAESIYMPDTDFSVSADARTGAPIDAEGRHFSDLDLRRDAESIGGAEDRRAEKTGMLGNAAAFDDSPAFDDEPAPGDSSVLDDSPPEIAKEDIWGDLSEAGAEEEFGERVAELDWTDPGFGFGASEPEAPETETVEQLEQQEDETESADDSTGIADGARFVEMPVMLGEFQTSIDEAGMASTSPHEPETAPQETIAAGEAPPMPATTEESVEADFRGDEAAAAMAAGESGATEPPADSGDEPGLDDEAGVVAYSPEPPRDEDLPHFTPKVPTVREFFATLGSRKPPSTAGSAAFTARAALPDAASQATAQADDLPLATDAFSDLFPGEEIAEEDTRAAFALSGALSGTSHNPVPEKIQTPPQPQEPVATENQAQESEEDIRRFREWLDGLADS